MDFFELLNFNLFFFRQESVPFDFLLFDLHTLSLKFLPTCSACLEVVLEFWVKSNLFRYSLKAKLILNLPNMGGFFKQINQLPTKSHVELEDNFIVSSPPFFFCFLFWNRRAREARNKHLRIMVGMKLVGNRNQVKMGRAILHRTRCWSSRYGRCHQKGAKCLLRKHLHWRKRWSIFGRKKKWLLSRLQILRSWISCSTGFAISPNMKWPTFL